MIFLKKSDFTKLISNQTLSVITNNNDVELDDAEGWAIDEMSAYLSNRYDTSKIFDPNNRNGLIVLYLSDIVLYHLHSSSSPDNIPELREKRYKNAVDWLEKTADGFTNPNLPALNIEKTPLRFGNSLAKQNHYY